MIAQSFNTGWGFRPKANPFHELGSTPPPFEPVTLPHDAMLAAGRDDRGNGSAAIGFFKPGTYEYLKTFYVPEDWRDKRLTLRFEGIYRNAVVRINGEFAGERPYGYSELVVKADSYLRYGTNNTIQVEARAYEDSRWYSGGGIYRDTSLFLSGPVHIALDGVRITTPDLDNALAVVAVETRVQNESMHRRTVEVLTDLVNSAGEIVATDTAPLTVGAGTSEVLRQRACIESPELWSVDRPYLYSCRTRVLHNGEELDQDQNRFGVRSLCLDPIHGLRLNKEAIKLRGACIHHDNGVIGAATIDRAEFRRVELLKQAGFNALRSAHHPMSRALLTACDQLGVLVMDETFDAWHETKMDHDYSLAFSTWWERDLEAMVAKDFNHPSVILYSIGNEVPEVGNPAGAVQGRRLAEKIRALDSSRFVTNGVNALLATLDDVITLTRESGGKELQGGINTALTTYQDAMGKLMTAEFVTDRTAESFAAVDLAGYNYMDARYELDAKLFPNRVIVGTETYPTNIDRNWRLVQDNSQIIGDFTWTGWDFLGEVGVGRTYFHEDNKRVDAAAFMATYPWVTAWCGDIDITGHRRPQSYYREIVFGLRKDPYLAVQPPSRYDQKVLYSSPWSWGDVVASWSWSGSEGRPVAVEVYSDADEVELLVNGRSAGRSPAGPSNRFRAKFVTTYEPGELLAVSYASGSETGRMTLKSASGPVTLRASVDREQIAPDDTDLAFIALSLVDDDGNVFTCEHRSISVELTGPAVLQGFGSGNPADDEDFLNSSHSTFNGRALAVIRPTGEGRIKLTFSAAGCEPVEVECLAKADPARE